MGKRVCETKNGNRKFEPMKPHFLRMHNHWMHVWKHMWKLLQLQIKLSPVNVL